MLCRSKERKKGERKRKTERKKRRKRKEKEEEGRGYLASHGWPETWLAAPWAQGRGGCNRCSSVVIGFELEVDEVPFQKP